MSFLQRILILIILLSASSISSSTMDTESTTQSPLEKTFAKIRKIHDELENDEKQLKIDREKLAEEKQILNSIEKTDIFQLNVGGEIMFTTRETLTKIPKSLFSFMFNGRWEQKLQIDQNGNIFLDFNPLLFRHLLDQLQIIIETEHLINIHPPSQPSLVEPFKNMLRKLGLHQLLPLEKKNIITFNVGGQIITNQRRIFIPVSNSTSDTIVVPSKTTNFNHESDVFLDYNPKIFQHLIKQLREGSFKSIPYSGLSSYGERISFGIMLFDLRSYTCVFTNSSATVADTSISNQIFWSFDSNYNDLYNVYNGVAINNAGFISPGYTGYGSALSLSASQSQYVLVPKFLNMTHRSFTWELWAYPMNLGNVDHVLVGMCESHSLHKCLHLLIRNKLTYLGFYTDDCRGSTIVDINQWHHFAFVYDYSIHTQYIYLNGQLECKRNSSGPFLGNSDALTIGAMNISSATFYWTGYIDQLSYVPRAKTEIEILTDATLVAYYSFDNGSYYDSGPNKINGIGINLSRITGRINQGILFNASGAYFQANGFTLLGASYRSYSIALWIYRLSGAVGSGTIVHLSAHPTGTPGWSLPIIGLTSSGEIAVQSVGGNVIAITGPTLPFETWTHVVTSYSAINGIRLWINGVLVSASGPFRYASSGKHNTITLGSSLAWVSTCLTCSIKQGQFYGVLDELRIYSRELNACDIYALLNP